MKAGEKDKKGIRNQKSKLIFINEDLKKEYPDRMKYFGKVKLKFDPVAYQRKERDEWD